MPFFKKQEHKYNRKGKPNEALSYYNNNEKSLMNKTQKNGTLANSDMRVIKSMM